MPANESYVGRATSAVQQRLNIDDAGFKALKADLAMSNKVLQDGLIMGAITLAAGGGKVKAAWEGIKWGWMARAGVAGLAMVTGAAYALAIGIRKGVTESGVLQAALQRLDQTKVLTAQFTSILGSISAARTRVGELFAFVANSKFNFGDVAGASRAISILSNGAEGGISTLSMLGKVADTTGNNLQSVGLAYGQFISQARNGQDIAGTVSELRNMGVISESTASQLINLQRSGASGAILINAFKDSIAAVAATSRGTGETIEQLQDRVDKLKGAMAAGFGQSWTAQEARNLRNQATLYEALIPAVTKLGDMLEFVSRPAVNLKNALYSAAGTDFFKESAATLAQMAVTLPLVAAGYQVLKGAGRFIKTAGDIGMQKGFEGMLDKVKGAIFPSAMSRNMAGRATDFLGKAAESEGGTATMYRALAKTAEIGSKGMANLSKGLVLVRTGFMRAAVAALEFAGPAVAITGLAYLGTKAFEAWRDQVHRSESAVKDFKEALDAGAQIKASVAGLQTMDDKLNLITQATHELTAAQQHQGEVNADLQSTEEERAAAQLLVRSRRRALDTAINAPEGNLGMTAKEYDYQLRMLSVAKQIRDIEFQGAYDRAGLLEKQSMLQGKVAEKAALAADAEKEHGKNAAEMLELQTKITAKHAERAGEATALGAEFGGLNERRQLLEKFVTPMSAADRAKIDEQTRRGAPGPSGEAGLGYELGEINDRMAKIRARQKELRNPGAEEAAVIGQLAAERTQGKFGEAQRLEAAAEEARKKGNILEAQHIETRAAAVRIEAENAKTQEKEYAQQLATLKEQTAFMVSQTKAERDANAKTVAALDAASKGRFDIAGALTQEAVAIQDRAHDEARQRELVKEQNLSPAEAAAQVKRESAQRYTTRAATYRTGAQAAELESQIAVARAGAAGAYGGNSGQFQVKEMGLEAAKEFRSTFASIKASLGDFGETAEGQALASKQAYTQVQANVLAAVAASAVAPGTGMVADSLARVGATGGGGVYGGVEGTDIMARTNSILDQMLNQVREMAQKSVVIPIKP
jgi:hypothetical protein